MSRKSDIYANYRNKIDAHNATIGGEPSYDSYPSVKLVHEIQALPVTYGGPLSGKGYLHPDGTVTEIRYSYSGIRLPYLIQYKDQTHFRGYREPMGPNQYFEG